VVASGRYNALVALGCVIRGETPHFEYVCMEASVGLGAVARSATIPVAFGVLTTDDADQARARAGSGTDNKGYEAAIAAVEMVSLYRGLGSP
jgi:6,7-dimethyl-8-ribityllumazine synthase